MRKLIYTINHTVDGCLDHTAFMPDEGLFDYYIRLVQDAGLIVYGRITYELMVPYWPDILKNPAGETKADVEYARAFVAAQKVVFSRTLKSVEDENTRISSLSLKEEILKLKEEDGKDILVGGVDIPSQLTELGLIDEYLFIVMPIFAGKGRRFLDDVILKEKIRLRLLDSKTFESGSIALRYQKQG
ncbi:MAG TPA: dihydrofolate reductase family protein [Puia sp.]|nr:dihydrofolate reductase family protein [Puia sp.]